MASQQQNKRAPEGARLYFCSRFALFPAIGNV
jgi:hypothetical protein